MKLNLYQYNQMLMDNHISVIYSGPIWTGGIDGMAEMLQRRLDFDDISFNASQCVFSVFVEQMNNMLMYSAEKEYFERSDNSYTAVSKGLFVLGIRDKTYFIQTGNVVTDSSAEFLKNRIDHLNTLDKKEMRQYFKERAKADNDNPESKGAGLGLIEIARRATSRIEYEFTPYGDGLSYFSMHVTI